MHTQHIAMPGRSQCMRDIHQKNTIQNNQIGRQSLHLRHDAVDSTCKQICFDDGKFVLRIAARFGQKVIDNHKNRVAQCSQPLMHCNVAQISACTLRVGPCQDDVNNLFRQGIFFR